MRKLDSSAFRIARSRPLLQTVNSRPSAAQGKEKTARRDALSQPTLVQDPGVAFLDCLLLFLFLRLLALTLPGRSCPSRESQGLRATAIHVRGGRRNFSR